MTSGLPQPPEEPSASEPAPPVRSTWLAVAAAVLGVLALALPWAPTRAYFLLALGLPGLVIGLIGSTGRRGGKGWAAFGALLSVIALVMGIVMTVNANRDTTSNADDHTTEILTNELDVRFGERSVDPETGTVFVIVTLYNKGKDLATYGVTFKLDGRDSDDSCEAGAHVTNLAPGASYQETITSCGDTALQDLTVQVTKATKNQI